MQYELGWGANKSELNAFKHSLQYMNNVLADTQIPEQAGIAIEYKIPQTSKRIDFIITGYDENKKETAIIVELKQWSSAEMSTKDGIVSTFVGGTVREVNHPSYQAWSYAVMIKDYNETVQNDH